MLISVILPSFCGEYPGCAHNREALLHEAIESFMQNTFESKELVVVSDGCRQTIEIAEGFKQPSIKVVQLPKQPLFSGNVRQAGLALATGKIITYLDSDDVYGSNHLQNIAENFGDAEWVYYNDYIETHGKKVLKVVELKHGSIGTSSIAHLRELPVTWSGCDDYGQDWKLIQQLLQFKWKKIYGCDYRIRHVPL